MDVYISDDCLLEMYVFIKEIKNGYPRNSERDLKFSQNHSNKTPCPFYVEHDRQYKYTLKDLAEQPSSFWKYFHERYPVIAKASEMMLVNMST